MCTVAAEIMRGCQIPWGLSYRRFWAMGPELRLREDQEVLFAPPAPGSCLLGSDTADEQAWSAWPVSLRVRASRQGPSWKWTATAEVPPPPGRLHLHVGMSGEGSNQLKEPPWEEQAGCAESHSPMRSTSG